MTQPAPLSRPMAVAACAAVFVVLQLAVDAYHMLSYGVTRSGSGTVAVAVIVATAGAVGYVCGTLLLGRDFRLRTIVFIGVLGYFVSYSITYLLASVTSSPWV